MQGLEILVRAIDLTANILIFAIFVRILMSWMPGRSYGRFYEILENVTEPIFRVVRLIPHRIGMIDLSPMIAAFGIDILRDILLRILYSIF